MKRLYVDIHLPGSVMELVMSEEQYSTLYREYRRQSEEYEPIEFEAMQCDYVQYDKPMLATPYTFLLRLQKVTALHLEHVSGEMVLADGKDAG